MLDLRPEPLLAPRSSLLSMATIMSVLALMCKSWWLPSAQCPLPKRQPTDWHCCPLAAEQFIWAIWKVDSFRVRLRFQIHRESKIFQIQSKNDSHLKQNHFKNCLIGFLVFSFMKEMRKIKMTYLPLIGVVVQYTLSQNTWHHKIHYITKLEAKSIWVFDSYDLDCIIASARLSHILSIDMSFVEEVKSSDAF
jgi:hypothetical protein